MAQSFLPGIERVIELMNGIRDEVNAFLDTGEPAEETITLAEHREIIERIVSAFNRDSQVWLDERNTADRKLIDITKQCNEMILINPTSILPQRILRIIRGDTP